MIYLLIGLWALMVSLGFIIMFIMGIIFEYPDGLSLKEMLGGGQ
jgi:hypothetical protein